MAKKSPKLGDEIVDPPTTQVITDPAQIEAALGDLEGPNTINLTQAAAAGDALEAILAKLQADEEAQTAAQDVPGTDTPQEETQVSSGPSDPGPTLLLEDGNRVKIEGENVPPAYYCTGQDGLGYYHVSDHPKTGEWVYRYIP